MKTTSDHPETKYLDALLAARGPSHREDEVRAVVTGILDTLGADHETDGAGNVTVRIAGADTGAAPVVIAAHMDELGLVVTKIEDDGRLLVDRSGGLHPHKIGECAVDLLTDGTEPVPGVLSYGSMHSTGQKEKREQGISWKDFHIFTGFSKDELTARGVRPGSTAVPAGKARNAIVFGPPDDPFIAARALDDRGGVMILLQLLESLRRENVTPARPLVLAFTVHEEGGCHGAKVVAHRVKPAVFIAVDICPLPPGAPLTLDDRPAVWAKDTATHYDHGVTTALIAAARAAGTEMQAAVYDLAASDASRAYAAGAAPRAAAVGFVCDNSHGFEVARLSSFQNLVKTLVTFLGTWH